MKYDYYSHCAAPEDFRRKYSGLIQRFGIEDQANQHLAFFRDQAVVEALNAASAEVKDCFVSNGFSLTCHDASQQEHSCATDVAKAREMTMAKLKADIAALPNDADWNGFDVDAFFAAAEESPAEKATQVLGAKYADDLKRFVPEGAGRALSHPLSMPAFPA